MKKHISVPQPGQQENSYMEDVRDLLRGGRAGLQEGAFQQNMLSPYQYGLAGLDAQYETAGDRSGRMAELQKGHDTALAAMTQLKQAKTPKAKRAARQAIAATLGSDAANQITGKKGNIKGAKLKKYLRGQVRGAQGEMNDVANAPLRVTGFKEQAGSAAERAREQALYAQEQDLLKKSLSMDSEDVLAADPALKRSLEEERAKLDQAQVGQFGTLAGAQGGTVGAVQNAAMAQRQAEAISNARRENIGLYAGLQTQQGGFNTQKAAAKQALAGAPSAAQQGSALNFGQLSQGYGGLLAAKQNQRQMQFQANSFNQTQPGIGESILKGIGSLLQPFKQSG